MRTQLRFSTVLAVLVLAGTPACSVANVNQPDREATVWTGQGGVIKPARGPVAAADSTPPCSGNPLENDWAHCHH
jgi:hypothetical protein